MDYDTSNTTVARMNMLTLSELEELWTVSHIPGTRDRL